MIDASTTMMSRVDHWRRGCAGPLSADANFKEWAHFCVPLPSTHGYALFNASAAETRGAKTPNKEARLLSLLRDDDAWCGALQTSALEPASLLAGEVDFRLGASQVRWCGDEFRLTVHNELLRADIRLIPRTWPTPITTVALGPASDLHWLACPRLEANGWIECGARRIAIERAPAYHDHNWGHFRWGGELAWEWGVVQFLTAGEPWTVVLARVSDGRRHRVLAQSALVWAAERPLRTFQNREIEVAVSGRLSQRHPFTIPRLARLALPDVLSAVPTYFELNARGASDWIALEVQPCDAARIALPDEAEDLKLVVLNESCGPARVRGSIAGRAFEGEGTALMEFVHG